MQAASNANTEVTKGSADGDAMMLSNSEIHDIGVTAQDSTDVAKSGYQGDRDTCETGSEKLPSSSDDRVVGTGKIFIS